MGLFRRKKETRGDVIEDSCLSAALLSALNLSNGITVAQAINIPSLAGCVEFISNAVAMLPVKLYKETDDEIEELKTDRRVFLLNDDTGDLLDAFQMKKAFVRDCLLHGSGYIYIKRERNKIESLHYVKASDISVNKNIDPIFKSAYIMVGARTYQDFDFLKITRNTEDGIKGIGIVEENDKILNVAYNALMFENALTKNGGNKKGFLQAEKPLGTTEFETLKNAWRELYSNNSNNIMFLNAGLKFQESSNTLVEMQLNENKKTNADEICKLFNLSSDIISGKANEDGYASAFKIAVLPLIKSIETALNKYLLLENEKDTHYFAFDITESLKGDTLKRYQAYRVALQSNFMQPDEVRYREDLKPLGLDFIKLGLHDVLYNPKTKEVYTPNTNKTTVINNMKGGDDIEN